MNTFCPAATLRRLTPAQLLAREHYPVVEHLCGDVELQLGQVGLTSLEGITDWNLAQFNILSFRDNHIRDVADLIPHEINYTVREIDLRGNRVKFDDHTLRLLAAQFAALERFSCDYDYGSQHHPATTMTICFDR